MVKIVSFNLPEEVHFWEDSADIEIVFEDDFCRGVVGFESNDGEKIARYISIKQIFDVRFSNIVRDYAETGNDYYFANIAKIINPEFETYKMKVYFDCGAIYAEQCLNTIKDYKDAVKDMNIQKSKL